MRYPYDVGYQPPFPVLRVVLRNSDEGLDTPTKDALLDTGSDGSIVPIAYLRQILAPALSDTRIRSHWGEWRPVQLFVVDLELDGLILPGIFVVGDEQGDEIVLGRNVLNKLRLLLDGPANLTEILCK
ncbi:MAG: hypothetical protein GY832_09035 [Chloroflexi bacterium]|nr:hypothetical protein [Chloroflexota bacterium]